MYACVGVCVCMCVYIYIYIYIYMCVCVCVCVCVCDPGDQVQSQVKSYQKLKKWYLIPLCLTLCIIR